MPSNRCLPKWLKEDALQILTTQLNGFGPTLAAEKLKMLHNINISKETVRRWLIQAGIYHPKQVRRKIHKLRDRRPCFGELIQADGSHHRWFGEDCPMTNLIVMIDDATSKITSLHFSKGESLDAYFKALESHLVEYGRPRALYTDKAAVFKPRVGNNPTQLNQALDKLKVELILANSPQAKGRVERANRTLQDRLVKELCLRGIKTIEEANKYLPEYIKEYNHRFAKEPMSKANAHRSIKGYDLDLVLCRHEERILNTSCAFQFANQYFQLQGLAKTRSAKGRKVHLLINKKGEIRAFVDGREYTITPTKQYHLKATVKTRKELQSWQPRIWKPKASHPWRRWVSKNRSRGTKNVL